MSEIRASGVELAVFTQCPGKVVSCGVARPDTPVVV
jgi:hypothetical protein